MALQGRWKAPAPGTKGATGSIQWSLFFSVKLALRKRLHLVRGVAACTDVEEGPPAKGGAHLMSP
jgi:hypothetical protein